MLASFLGVLFLLRYVSSYELEDGKHAVVTLVSGSSSGYVAGAIALGQSIIDVKSKLKRVVMVTPDVDQQSRKQMSRVWEVVEVEPIYCNHKHNLDPTQYDLSGDRYQAGLKRWSSTCTKFAAWKLTQFKRLIFMDADMLVVEPIDDALYEFSTSSFLAAPETFPPDNFNSGFMVLEPSIKTFEKLLQLNEDVGSAEGGDQGVFNNGFCPKWQFVGPQDKDCGRLPWLFNVEAVHYDKYKTLRAMGGQRAPAVIHFVSDGKPWAVLVYEYVSNIEIPDSTRNELAQQAVAHLLWRRAYFRGSGEPPSDNHFLLDAVNRLGQVTAGGTGASNDDKDQNNGNPGSAPSGSQATKSSPPSSPSSSASAAAGGAGRWSKRSPASSSSASEKTPSTSTSSSTTTPGTGTTTTSGGKKSSSSGGARRRKKRSLKKSKSTSSSSSSKSGGDSKSPSPSSSSSSSRAKKIKDRLARAKRVRQSKAAKTSASSNKEEGDL